MAAEAGYTAVVGNQKVLLKTVDKLPQGIYLDKSLAPNRAGRYRRFMRLGLRLTAYDEEGFVPFNALEYQKQRVAEKTFRYVERFFAWGQWQIDVIGEKLPIYARKLIAVGHPRIDMTREELREFHHDDVKTLQDRYGPFILINTNFSFYNHFLGKGAEFDLLEKGGKIIDEAQRQFYLMVLENKKLLFYAFVKMIARLRQQLPEVSIVVRPHPSENREYWKEVLPPDEKTHVIHEGNVLPWLMAAEVLIHNSCTTGIEGFLLDRPVFSYRPVDAEEGVEHYLPNAISEEFRDLDDLVARVEPFFLDPQNASREVDAEKRKLLSHYIAAMEGPFSCERIVECLQTVQPPQLTMNILLYRLYSTMRRMKNSVMKKPRRTYETQAENAEAIRMNKYKAQKFPGVELSEVHASLAKFRTLLDRFSHIQVAQIEKDLFQISNTP
jgi:surface carbohydrate biosynthesis protein